MSLHRFRVPRNALRQVFSKMMRAFRSSFLAVFGLSLGVSLGLGGCASGGMLDQLPPSMGGEPAALPAKPKENQYKFPAVHDMPPARATATP